jgi:hypothetical protein
VVDRRWVYREVRRPSAWSIYGAERTQKTANDGKPRW